MCIRDRFLMSDLALKEDFKNILWINQYLELNFEEYFQSSLLQLQANNDYIKVINAFELDQTLKAQYSSIKLNFTTKQYDIAYSFLGILYYLNYQTLTIYSTKGYEKSIYNLPVTIRGCSEFIRPSG
eukprot:TRINITY_DN46227_c0_g1_i1.p2 TRINITY_DN46227_c0_g1~~TRINITY_DN46227_c0_g1_i1.p2  ORF type:complete len:144 (+),score=15.02 TRINITY_DN46227_c0_g1_i1:54-434(+)